MTGCGIRRGFFVLRECGAPPVGVCSLCFRPVCAEHTVPDAALLCVECHARQAQPQDDPSSSSAVWPGGSGYYAYRHHYYSDSHYRPIDTGASPAPYYDEYDVRSFEGEATEPESAGDEGDDAADFQDS